MTIEEYKQINPGIEKLLGPWIIPLSPEIGFYVNVNGVDVPKDVFPEEFESIAQALANIHKKLNAH